MGIRGTARVLFLKSKPGKPGGATISIDIEPEVRAEMEDAINALNGKAVEVGRPSDALIIGNKLDMLRGILYQLGEIGQSVQKMDINIREVLGKPGIVNYPGDAALIDEAISECGQR